MVLSYDLNNRISEWKSFHYALIILDRRKEMVMMIILGLVFTRWLSWKTTGNARLEIGKRRRTQVDGYNRDDQRAKRKADFVERTGDDYGYAKSPCGFIDNWRAGELTGLIHPNADSYEEDEKEVYLDYAGSALPTQSQLDSIRRLASLTLANPHSTGPAASRTTLLVEQVNKRILDLLDANPGRYAAFRKAPINCSLDDLHPGYEILYTSGTTEALRIVAERFPFGTASDNCCGQKSLFVYPQNSHTSVIGMRGPVLAQGGQFVCKPMEELWKDLHDNNPLRAWSNDDVVTQCHCLKQHLLALPLECNFGGGRVDCQEFVSALKTACSDGRHRFYTLLDIAKAASTSEIHLKTLNPDFAVLSFYKLFGEPTGLGCLLVKRTAMDVLCPENPVPAFYFGGGSVDAVLASTNYVVPRSEPSPLARFSNGTIHFRGIVALHAGLDELERLGGVQPINRHAVSLAKELVRRLKRLVHDKSGCPAIRLYGAWKKYAEVDDMPCPGPTVSFNIVRDDGSYVGYNEVSKLAALNCPPIQFRTGCFCNPGACQLELGFTNDDVLYNYQKAGHVCGDQVDMVKDRPTGAIRVSFGKDSIWEDLDAFVTFVERLFVCRADSDPDASARWDASPRCTILSELYLFPIKSCAAQRVKRWKIASDGKLAFDREFALVDSSGAAMRLQTYPKMALLRPVIDAEAGTMTVSAPGLDDIVVSLVTEDEGGKTDEGVVKVCGNKCLGSLWGDRKVSEWFSCYLGVRCWLARYMTDRYELSGIIPSSVVNSRSPGIAFANEHPLLLLSENAVDTLNLLLKSRNQKFVTPRCFRPNMVVRLTGRSKSVRGNLEDGWTVLEFTRKKIKFEVVGPCPRCSMVDVDPTSGMKGKTLRILAEYRRSNGQINFGIFLRGSSQTTAAENELWVEEGEVIYCE